MKKLLEVHLFDFGENLYGQDLEVTFTTFIRSERKFDSVQELAMQIERDVVEAKKG